MRFMAYHSYWYHLLNWMSQTINTIVFCGHHDIGVSSRAWAEQGDPFWDWMRRALDAILGDGHCQAAWLVDVANALDVINHDEDLRRDAF